GERMSRRPTKSTEGEPAAGSLSAAITRASHSLEALSEARGPELALALALIVEAVSREAARTARFSASLQKAINAGSPSLIADPERAQPRRTGRRDPGVLDPFAAYAQGSESALREQLAPLSLEQLRDIVAEHGMDNDRLAMKWKDSNR